MTSRVNGTFPAPDEAEVAAPVRRRFLVGLRATARVFDSRAAAELSPRRCCFRVPDMALELGELKHWHSPQLQLILAQLSRDARIYGTFNHHRSTEKVDPAAVEFQSDDAWCP